MAVNRIILPFWKSTKEFGVIFFVLTKGQVNQHFVNSQQPL